MRKSVPLIYRPQNWPDDNQALNKRGLLASVGDEIRFGVACDKRLDRGALGSVCGYGAGKRIKGRKRHIMTDTCGHLLALRAHSAGIQDRPAR